MFYNLKNMLSLEGQYNLNLHFGYSQKEAEKELDRVYKKTIKELSLKELKEEIKKDPRVISIR